MTYKIRELDFGVSPMIEEEGCAYAHAEGYNCYYEIELYRGVYDLSIRHGKPTQYKSEEEARAAAQAHHEQQLMKWLEPVCHICEGNDPDGWQVNCPIHDDISKMKIYGNTFHEHAPTKYSTPKDKD